MGISLGWVVFFVAGVTGAPPAERGAAQISYTVKMVEAEGVGWREAVFTHLKPVTRQGAATVWTLPKNATASLIKEICKSPAGAVVAAPRVTAFSGVPAAIQVRGNRTFVTQVAWNGDEIGAKATPEDVRVGWHATMIGRPLDQGILVKLVVEDTEIRGVHKMSVNLPHELNVTKSDIPVSGILQGEMITSRMSPLAFEAKPFEATGSAANDAKKAKLQVLWDKALTAYKEGKYIECEALARRAMELDPEELAHSMLAYKAKAERRLTEDKQRRVEKHAETEAFLGWTDGFARHLTATREVNESPRQETPELPSDPSCDCPAGAAPIAGGSCKDALELPEIANQEVVGEWLIPKGECLLVSFGPHTVADKDGKAIVKERLAVFEADEARGVGPSTYRAMTGAPRFGIPAPPAPMAPPPANYGAPIPEGPAPPTAGFRPTPPSSFDQVLPPARYMRDDLKYLAPGPDAASGNDQAATQPTKSQEKNTEAPARIARVPAPVAAPTAKMPALPDRSIPQGIHKDGTKAKLPALPEDEMDDDSSDSESAEPLPSPQIRKPRTPKPAGDAGTTKASFTLPKASTVFLPSVFLPGSSVGFQFLMPLKPLSLRLPFNQRLEIEIFGRVVPDSRLADSDK